MYQLRRNKRTPIAARFWRGVRLFRHLFDSDLIVTVTAFARFSAGVRLLGGCVCFDVAGKGSGTCSRNPSIEGGRAGP